jgi:iron complex outermembrane receptor protein
MKSSQRSSHDVLTAGRSLRQCLLLLTLLVPPWSFAQNAPTELEEILVTAQRREQNINDVSIAITAFTGDFIRRSGLNQSLELAAFTPGLTVATTNGDANPIFSLRGVGQLDYPANSNPAVSVYLNEVFVPSHAMLGFQLFDMERVEVLKGPQGTLYGRNTTGGAINFITRKPRQDEAANGLLRLDYGRYDTYEVEGALGGAIADTLAGRIAVMTRQRNGGHQVNRFDDSKHGEVDRVAGRAMLEWAPTEGLSVLFAYQHGEEDSDNQYYDFRGFADPVTFGPCATRLNNNPNGCVDLFGNTETEGSPFNVNTNPLFGSIIDSDADGGSITVDYDFGRATLTSVSGYQTFDRVMTEDFDATPQIQFDDRYENSIWLASQEVRFTSDDSWPFDWIFGLYYSEDSVKGFSLFALDDFGAGRLDARWKQETRSAAAFGNFQLPLSERWKLIGGLRYTDEKKEFAGGSGLGTPDTAFLLSFTDTDIGETDLSGELGLEYRPSEDRLLYAKLSRGFKSGGFDGGFSSSNDELLPVDPEDVVALEVGIKAALLQHSLQLNTSAYFYQWNDFQSQVSQLRGGIPQLVLDNAGDAEIAGIEMALSWLPMERLSIGAGLNYFFKSEIVESLDSSLVGNDTPNTPELTFNGDVRYDWPMMFGGEGTAFVQAGFSWKDDVFFEVANRDTVAAESYWLVDMRLGITALNNQLEIAAWGRNLSDEEYRIGGNTGADFTADVFYYGMPRTYGLSMIYSFK